MDTNRIKRFATEARNILKAGIAAKIASLGFDRQGNVPEQLRPTLMQGGSLWNGLLQTEGFYHQWMSLYQRIQQIGIKDVYEEAAYTWFNRLCAIRILQKNDLCQPVLAYADAARTPIIVDEARQGHLPPMKEEERVRLMELLDDDTKVTEQFAVLITAWCHDNPIINGCFGAIADYTALLLPNNILAEGGFVDLLNRLSSESNDELAQSLPSREGGRLKANHTELITDDDYRSPELIGWLYQFYISERKDEVFAKKGKFEADEIPAATQIFTPNWIVKYMVQNTVGRIYLDNNPHETQLQKKWRYIVPINNEKLKINNSADDSKRADAQTIVNYSELTDLRVADLACGSGHILNECFDLLYDLYIAEGYSRSEAITNIFRHNLTGIDLDPRAKQLATFALLLKACQKDASFASAECMPNVLDMRGVVPDLSDEELSEACLDFMGGYENVAGEMLEQDFEVLRDAENLGSIMQFCEDEDYLAMLRCHYDDCMQDADRLPENTKKLLPGVKVILALTTKYHALVMNPPYMGSGNMNSVLSKYVKDNYAEGKADLFSVFMMLASRLLADNGKYGMINMQSWMFLSSFENLRTRLLSSETIDSMLHLGPRTFDELSGEVVQNTAFVITKHQPTANTCGAYYRLVEGKNCADKERMFMEAQQGNGTAIINSKLYIVNYPSIPQNNFEKIPGSPIGYSVSESVMRAFEGEKIKTHFPAGHGILSGNNEAMFREWWSVNFDLIKFGAKSAHEFHESGLKYAPIAKGGDFRKWYGSYSIVAKFDIESLNYMRQFPKFTLQNSANYFKQGVTWGSIMSSNNLSARMLPQGYLFNHSTPSAFPIDVSLASIVGFLSSKVCSLLYALINPSISCNAGDINKIPTVDVKSWDKILARQNISISKLDWDAHETSWDFQRNPLWEQQLTGILINMQEQGVMADDATIDDIEAFHLPHMMQPLEVLMENYKAEWEDHFMQLHANEEELNRQFISIYGLEDELTPDVPLSEITILQQGEITIDNQLIINN